MLARTTKKLLALISVALMLLAGVVSARTALYRPRSSQTDAVAKVAIPSGAAERLARAVRIPTVSHSERSETDFAAFSALHRYLAASFPRAHSTLLREAVNDYSLLFTWPGSDRTLKPILLMGHLDAVPVEPGTEGKWQQSPFSGAIVDGFIWGRGAIDNKSAVVGILEAVEMLVTEGFQPKRTIYLAFGHDEERGGTDGARAIAALLKGRGVELEMVLDEGGVIAEGLLPGISAPVALIGVAEKGFVTIELNVRGTGGHSSLPPRESAIGILSAAITRLEENQMPSRLEGATRQFFDTVGPRFPIGQRTVFANLWLTESLVERKLESSPSTNAMIRTTTATTVFQAGSKDNVLATSARADINFRILPGDTVARVVEHVRRVIADSRIDVRIGGAFQSEPSAVSSRDSASFQILEHTIQSLAPDAVVAPYLVAVVTDARYFADFSRSVFRFLPLRLTSRDLERIHGIDERVAIDQYETAIRIYRQLLFNAASN
jgi:carboxypeptidase PM20D1